MTANHDDTVNIIQVGSFKKKKTSNECHFSILICAV